MLAEALSSKSGALYHLGRHRKAGILSKGVLELANESGIQRLRAQALMEIGIALGEDDPAGSLQASPESPTTPVAPARRV